jgi:methane/ammonia monooxygenase subunit C
MADTLTVTRDTSPEPGRKRPSQQKRPTIFNPGADDQIGAGSSWKPFLIMLGITLGIFAFYRIYQSYFAWTKGLDSAAPDYAKYWMKALYVNTGTLVILGSILMAWAMRDCQACVSQMETHGRILPRHEEHHIWIVWSLLVIFCIGLYAAASFFGEQDASWHQVAIRDTAFTPSHIFLFYGVFPVFGFTSAVAFLYARKHLSNNIYAPEKGFPVSWGLVLGSSSFLMFWVAVNEFMHSFVVPEELFSAPLHWGFITFGLLAGGAFAILFQTLPRVMELQNEEKKERMAAGVSA